MIQLSVHPLRTAILLTLFATVLFGCSNKVEHGQVTGILRSGKQPIGNARVVFVLEEKRSDKASRAEAITDAQGRYQLQNEDDDEGPVVGAYTVIVEDMAIYSMPRSPDGTLLKRPPVRFPEKYHSLVKSPLHFEIHPGSQQIDIDLQ